MRTSHDQPMKGLSERPEFRRIVQNTLYKNDQNISAATTHNIVESSCYKSVTGPKTTVELLLELTLVRRVRLSCSASLERESGPFDTWRPLNFERSCVTRRSSLQKTLKMQRIHNLTSVRAVFLTSECTSRVPGLHA